MMMWMMLHVTTLQQLSTLQHWEGTSFPVDPLRPLSNLYHNKLAICVDWAVDPVTKMGNLSLHICPSLSQYCRCDD